LALKFPHLRLCMRLPVRRLCLRPMQGHPQQLRLLALSLMSTRSGISAVGAIVGDVVAAITKAGTLPRIGPE